MSSLVDGLVRFLFRFHKRILVGVGGSLSMAERTRRMAGNSPSGRILTALPEITVPTQRLRFNVLYRGPQKFAWTEIPLAEVKAIRQACGTSVNDVILALVTATIRRYLEFHGDRVKGRLLRIMVPVNLRGNEQRRTNWGTAFPWFPVTIPLDIRNPRKLLAAVHRRTEFLKLATPPNWSAWPAGLLGMFPDAVQALPAP